MNISSDFPVLPNGVTPEMILWLVPLVVILALWEFVWKMIALWHSAGRKELAWFVCIAIFNTAGILPIIYIVRLNPKKIMI
jgi:hypothetical protein